MARAGKDAMRELDNILNASETYADRLTAFLQLKTAPKPKQSNTPFVLGGCDFSFDFDVDLVELLPKAQPAAAKEAEPECEEHTLREIINESPNSANSKAARPEQTKAAVALLPAKENVTTSQMRVIRSPSRSVRRSIPGSDRLRRVAIQRRSRSCGHRNLLKEFNNAYANNSSFLPTQSSTPLTDNQPAAESEKQTILSEASPPERSAPKPLLEHFEDSHELSNSAQSNSSISQQSMQRQSMSDSNIKRRTFTIEVGPRPGQLLLLPSGKKQLSPSNSVCNVSLRQSCMRPRSSADQSKLSVAPARRTLSVPSSEPEYIVPESPQLDLQQVVQNLTRNSSLATTPFMVVPMACLNAKPTNEQVKAGPSTVTPTARVTNRSIQTSCREIDLNEILTEDESDEEQQVASARGSSIQLLDLHYSRSKDSRRRSNRRTRQAVLNKPLQPAINGEKFAQELARISNYEVLDLRKRRYRAKQHPFNGHRERSIEQLTLPHKIPAAATLSSPHKISAAATTSGSDSDFLFNRKSMPSPPAPPLDFMDRSLHQRRSRLSRHETYMFESMSTERTALPPFDFRDNSIQSQPRKKKTKQRRTRARHREPPSDEDQLLEVCTPPAQFRWSKSRRKSELMETPETSLAAPPLQFIDVPETDAEEELQQQSIQSSYMEEQQKKEQLQKERQKQEQEKEQRQKEQLETEKRKKEQQEMEKRQREQQEEEQRQKEQLEMEKRQKEQQKKEQQEKEQQEQKQQQKRLEKEQEEMLHKEQQKKEKQLQMEQKQERQQELQKQKDRRKEQQKQQQEEDQQQLIEESNQEQVLKLGQLPPPEVVFKKPTAPASRLKRYKKSKVERELTRLTINLRNEPMPPDEQEENTDMDGVRRSRRGQVPLCNTWSHTVREPFLFMHKHLAHFELPACYKSTSPQRPTAANGISIKNRPPIASSTPCNPTAPISENRRRKKKPPPGEAAAQPGETHLNRKKVHKKKK
ncbi:inner centromere protein isoform X2 [Drosophila grimshawi]|uniref:inner centromere protein isoform X2 n=1 Tax=Drosophila grimshawi TaxID=7222 RepID=UPI000C86EFF2|nr:inner centromere protein isoform X2 [Drosophila grimshawi]